MFGIGAGEFVIILIVGLIVFGPSKLPEVGRAIGKGLREFRKAQAALSQTLNEIDETPKSSPPADKPPVKPLTTESFIGDKPVAQPTTQPATADTSQVTVDKPSQATVDKPQVTADDVIKSAKDNPLASQPSATVDKPQVTADDVIKSAKDNPLASQTSATVDKPQVTADDAIKSAKDNPLAKENQHEKISDGNPVDAANDIARTSSAGARSSSNGVDKQP